MATIEVEVDLEDYKNEIIYSFCKNNRCLLNNCNKSFKVIFQDYISDLEKSIYNFNDCKKTPEDFLRDLKDLYNKII